MAVMFKSLAVNLLDLKVLSFLLLLSFFLWWPVGSAAVIAFFSSSDRESVPFFSLDLFISLK